MDLILYYLQKKYNGNWLKIYDALKEKEKISKKDIDEINPPKNLIALLDDDYPNFLKEIYKPPFIVIKENEKIYYIYGKDLKERFEIVDYKNIEKTEKEYLDNLRKYKLDIIE